VADCTANIPCTKKSILESIVETVRGSLPAVSRLIAVGFRVHLGAVEAEGEEAGGHVRRLRQLRSVVPLLKWLPRLTVPESSASAGFVARFPLHASAESFLFFRPFFSDLFFWPSFFCRDYPLLLVYHRKGRGRTSVVGQSL
ncbi:unnamed protein product, partial [Scytosiphon promiscuus]